MSSDLYYQADEGAEEERNPTVEEEVATLKAQVARLVTAVQSATDRANRIEEECRKQKERLDAREPLFAATSEERQRIEELEHQTHMTQIYNTNPLYRYYSNLPSKPWKTHAVSYSGIIKK